MALLVNGERIESAVIEEERRMLRRLLAEKMVEETPDEIDQRAREWSRENVIERVLIRQAARKEPEAVPAEAVDQAAGPDASPEARQEAEMGLRMERLVARLTANAARPRRKDIVEYYRKNSATLQSEETVHAAHIVKNIDANTSEQAAREVLDQVRLRLEAGEPFEILADECSDCPGRGGDLGMFPRGQMVDEFDAVVFSLPPGQLSGIFRTGFGLHIAKVISRQAPGPLPLDEVSGQIEELLFSQKKQKLVDQYLDSLRAKASVEEVA